MTLPDDSGAQQGLDSIIECTEVGRLPLPLAIPEVRAHLDILKGAFSLIQGRSADVHEGLSAWLQSDEGAGEAETLQAWLASATCTLQGLLAVVQNEHQPLENAGLLTGQLPIHQVCKRLGVAGDGKEVQRVMTRGDPCFSKLTASVCL